MFLDRLFASTPEPTRAWEGESGHSGWINSDAGERVTDDTAMRLSAVWRCVSIISGDMKTLPWGVYEKQEGKRIRRSDHPVDYLISTEPNPEMDAATFIETMQVHRELKGAAYAEIERNYLGDPVALWILDPERVQPDRTAGGALYYRFRRKDGRESQLKPENVLHIKGLSYDGITCYSVLSYAKETIGGGLAQQKTSNTIFKNGLKPSAVFSHPGQLSDIAEKNLRSSIASLYAGSANAGRPILLQENMKVEKWSITPEEAQFLDSRKFTIEEIARWFGIKAYKLGLMDRETHSNIFQNAKEHIEECIMPRCVTWEKEVKRKLFRPEERGTLYTKFDFNAMLRGAPAERAEFYRNMRDLGALDIDEIRGKEDMDELPDGIGKTRLVPLNMQTLESAATNQNAKPKQAQQQAAAGIVAEVVGRTARKVRKAQENGKADAEFWDKVGAELLENLQVPVKGVCDLLAVEYSAATLRSICMNYEHLQATCDSLEIAEIILQEMGCSGQ